MGIKRQLMAVLLLAMICVSVLTARLTTPAHAANAQDKLSDQVDVVMTIDESGSMRYNDPQEFRKEAARLFIDLEAISGDQVGVVGFGSKGRVIQGMLQINGDAEREQLKSAINQVGSSDQWTDFNEGLKTTLAEYLAKRRPNHLGGVIFLTDGQMDPDPSNPAYGNNADAATKYLLEQVMPQFRAAGCPVFTIALTNNANVSLLQMISNASGGEFFSAQNSSDLQRIYAQVFARLKGAKNIPQNAVNLAPGQVVEVPVALDSSVKEATFLVTKGSPQIGISLKDPDGNTITSANVDNKTYRYRGSTTYDIYLVEKPRSGVWKVVVDGTNLTSSSSAQVNVIVYTNVELTMAPLGKVYALDTPVTVAASLEQDGKKITDQKILKEVHFTLSVFRPDNSRDEIRDLYDDGTHGDKQKGDGTFTTVYRRIDVQGEYIFNVNAEGGLFNKEVKESTRVSGVREPMALEPKTMDFGNINPGGSASKNLTIVSRTNESADFLVELRNVRPVGKATAMSVDPAKVFVSGNNRTKSQLTMRVEKGLSVGGYEGLLVFTPAPGTSYNEVSAPFKFHIPSFADIWLKWIILAVVLIAGGYGVYRATRRFGSKFAITMSWKDPAQPDQPPLEREFYGRKMWIGAPSTGLLDKEYLALEGISGLKAKHVELRATRRGTRIANKYPTDASVQPTLNGDKIGDSKRLMQPGDTIEVGGTKILYQPGEATVAEPEETTSLTEGESGDLYSD